MPAHIDEPSTEVAALEFRIAGWVGGADPNLPVSLHINDRAVAFTRWERPDLRQALPHFPACFGILKQVKLLDLLLTDGVEGLRSFSVRLRAGADEASRQVTITPGVADQLQQQLVLRSQTRAWLADRLRCPSCGAADDRLRRDQSAIVCTVCETEYAQDAAGAIDMRTAAIRETIISDRSDNVSSNPYEILAAKLIERTVAAGGWVLDCGAGARPFRTRHVVNVEIEDYFSTDVLAVGETLPFKDDTFDAAVSLAVLEHVRDPFACARELLRVVKPGGEIVCSVPFLQPVHGFPSHYYNMTREGLKNLFAAGEVVDCLTPLNGHPILTLQWFASEYLQGLPETERAKLGAMTLSEAASLPFPDTFAAGYVTSLSAAAMQTIACLNTVVVRKKAV